MDPMNDCSNKSDAVRVSLAKGPNPDNVPQIAIPERSSMAVAVSRGPNRNAVHTRIGIHRKANGYVSMVIGSTPPNTASPTRDRKSTRLNSSHLVISYAVFCLKKKKDNGERNSPPFSPRTRVFA